MKALIQTATLCTAVLLGLVPNTSVAAPPKAKSIGGLRLGMDANDIRRWAQQTAPNCKLEVSMGRELQRRTTGPTYMLSTEDPVQGGSCASSADPSAPDYLDYFTAFAISRDGKSPERVFRIALNRKYTPTAGAQYSGPSVAGARLLERLIEQYGRPAFIGETTLDTSWNETQRDKAAGERTRITTAWWGSAPFDRTKASCEGRCVGVTMTASVWTKMTPGADWLSEQVSQFSLEMLDSELDALDESRVKRLREMKDANLLKF